MATSKSASDQSEASSPAEDALTCTRSNDYMSRIPPLASEYIISAAHVVAATGFTLSAVAAASPQGSQLPMYGVSLFIAAMSLRIILFAKHYSAKQPYILPGTEMAILAAVLFVSNSLSSVATLCVPENILTFTAFSALDVTANWLQMVANAKTPHIPQYVLLKFLVTSAADGYVAASVAGVKTFVQLLWPAIFVKAALNVVTAFLAAQTVLNRDVDARSETFNGKTD